MSNVQHVVVGALMVLAGVLLALTTGEVDTPVVTLSKVGVVLAVLGVIEVGVGLVAIARGNSPSSTDVDG